MSGWREHATIARARSPRALKCRALLYTGEICSHVRANCAKGSTFFPSHLSPLSASAPSLPPLLVSPYPLLFHAAPLSAVSSSPLQTPAALSCSLKEGTRVSTFRRFIFRTELERAQSVFLWSRASGNAAVPRAPRLLANLRSIMSVM